MLFIRHCQQATFYMMHGDVFTFWKYILFHLLPYFSLTKILLIEELG